MENVFSWKIGLFLRIYCSCIRTHLAVCVIAVFQQSWFYGEWDENWEYINITVKELYPIVLALEL
jgi:hypothetical protein